MQTVFAFALLLPSLAAEKAEGHVAGSGRRHAHGRGAAHARVQLRAADIDRSAAAGSPYRGGWVENVPHVGGAARILAVLPAAAVDGAGESARAFAARDRALKLAACDFGRVAA